MIYAYIASISFFVGLNQVFKLLGYIGQNTVFSPEAITALRIIKKCAKVFISFVLVAEVYIIIFQSKKGEDIAGGISMGIFIIFIAIFIATAASLFEKKIQKFLRQ